MKKLIIPVLVLIGILLFPNQAQAASYDCSNISFEQTSDTSASITFKNIQPGLAFRIRETGTNPRILRDAYNTCAERTGESLTTTFSWDKDYLGKDIHVIVTEKKLGICEIQDIRAQAMCHLRFTTKPYDSDNPTDSGSGLVRIDHAERLCNQVSGETNRNTCKDCIEDEGVWTAVGCVPYSPAGFVEKILSLATGIGGGLALVIMLYGAFLVTTSGGNPENLQKGWETITSAAVGLIFIIFSIFILNFIGIQILKIPGL